MSRALWFAAGVGTAVYGSVKARRLAYRLSPIGLGDQAAALRLGAQALLDDIRAGARDREAQLLDGLGAAGPTDLDDYPPPSPVVRLPSRAVNKDTR